MALGICRVNNRPVSTIIYYPQEIVLVSGCGETAGLVNKGVGQFSDLDSRAVSVGLWSFREDLVLSRRDATDNKRKNNKNAQMSDQGDNRIT